MALHRFAVCFAALATLAIFGVTLGAQTPAPPAAYTVTASNSMAGPTTITKTYRLGSKVVVDERTPAPVAGGAMNIRTFYDLDKKEKLTWDPVNSAAACVRASFTGDWGDPFTSAGDLTQPGITDLGTETLHGFTARVVETAPSPDGRMKGWIDTKTNMVVKAQMIPPSGPAVTMIEITAVSLGPPPASVFAIPSYCNASAAPAEPVRPPSDVAEAAALTGGDGQNYMNADDAPISKDTCTVLFRVVKAGSMETIASGFQVALDPSVDYQHMPAYNIGTDAAGRTIFKGGNLHDVTSQLRNGVLRIDHVGKAFKIDLEFGSPGSSEALLYRHCFGPQTVLLFVAKNPASIGEGGGWLWVKSGKYAAASH